MTIFHVGVRVYFRLNPFFKHSVERYFAVILLIPLALPRYDDLAIITYKQSLVHPRAYQTRNRFALERFYAFTHID